MRATRQTMIRSASPLLLGLTAFALARGETEAVGQSAKNPPADRVTIEIVALEDLRQFRASVILENRQEVVAMTLPFRWGTGSAPFVFDSATHDGLRTEHFAVKTAFADTARQTILIGLIADLGGGTPPLPPDSGTVVDLYFTSTAERNLEAAATAKQAATVEFPVLDTATLPPSNTLQIVTPDIRSIRPRFEVHQKATETERTGNQSE